LYTTHYMEEAESLCDRLAIIDHGRIIAQGTLAELRALLAERDLVRMSGLFAPAAVHESLARVAGAEIALLDEYTLHVSMPEASRRLPELFAALSACGADVRGTTITQPNLETLFIKLTGKELRE
ncbi:MAG: export ABC transporter ATP-binding protein, partial [Bryobacteraceae bacterium]